MRLPGLLLLAMLALLPAARGQEVPRVGMRAGTHPDLGRLVFDWPSRVGYRVVEEDDRVVIRFDAPGRIDLTAMRRPPRNVLAVALDGEAVVVRITPGARPRHFRLGNRIVLDLRDPASGAASAAAQQGRRAAPEPASQPQPRPEPPAVAPRPAPPAAEAPASSATPLRPAAAPGPTQPTPLPVAVPSAPPAPATLPAPSALRLLAGAPAISVAAGPEAGLAVFRRGDWVYVVLDRAVAVDPASLRRHPVFGGLEVLPAGEATALRLRLAEPARLATRREAGNWILEATREPPAPDAPMLRVEAEAGPPARLLLFGGQPGGSVAMTDPETGETLLVGTLRQPGPGMPVARRLPEFDLVPTMLGAVIVARSDRLALRPTGEDRFALVAAAGGSLGLGTEAGPAPTAAAIAMTRLLELPEGPVPALLERLRNLLLSVQAAPPLARGPARRDAAETLIALGMPQEAQAMAAIALQEDPRSREDPRLLFAHGVAALLAGRLAEARGIEDPRLPPRDEVALWRALLAKERGADRAPALAATAPLILAYPTALRDRVLPMAAEALAEGEEPAAAAALLAQAGDAPGLDFARARLLEAQGETEAALAAYATVAQGRDRRQRAVALRRSAELRLASGAIDAAAAAEALEQSLFAWRDGAAEVALRRRVAALRIAAGQGAQAYALLEETMRLFPDQAPALRPELQEAFAAALETAPPLAAATLFEATPDLLPAGPRGEAAVQALAGRLAALDLPDRAAALLRRAMIAAGPGTDRAAIGARLAALRAEEGDAAGALAALEQSESDALDPALATRRTLLRARAMARRGARPEADALLATLGPAGAATRAELRAEARDWAGAAAAMHEHLAASLPAAPEPLGDDDRAAVARTAAYLALAGDEPGLAALRAAQGPRMEGGALAEAFGVLTADPVRGLADLPRLQRELGMMRLLPSRLEALRTGVQVAR